VVEIKPVNYISGHYLAVAPASASDREVPLLTFLFQRFPTKEIFEAFHVLRADLENALAMLHKQFILFQHFESSEDGTYARVVSTELEYALFNHRAAYDLLNRLAIAFLNRHRLAKNTMPDSFRKVVEKTLEERLRYGLSTPLSEFYEAKKERFMLFRSVRDAIGHHGDSIELVFKMPNGFGISEHTLVGRKLKEGGIWERMKPIPQDVGSSFAFLCLLTDDLFTCLNDFTAAFINSFSRLPPETAPNHKVYARTRLFEHHAKLQEYLADPWRMGKR
jgi:hypothetical protein